MRGTPWNVVSVAAPVHDTTGDTIAALSIVIPQGSGNLHNLFTAVRTAARDISRSVRPH